MLLTVDYAAPDAAGRLCRSMHETGFGVLVGHPLSNAAVLAICDEWRAFFATSAKDAYRHADGGQDGYFPPPEPEAATGGVVRDRKEFFHVCPGGRYPREVSQAALDYYTAARGLAATLLRWLEAGTPARTARRWPMPLAEMIDGRTGTMLRIQHYLPLTSQQAPGSVRALAHEDINLITLLPAPTDPGLQVWGPDGAWHDIPHDTPSLIVNGGEMLQLLTDGYYPATRHRVVSPDSAQHRGSRFSMPLFVHPAGDVVLAPGRTAATFLQERVEALRQKGWAVAPGGRSG